MKTIIFSTDINLVDEWIARYDLKEVTTCYDIESLQIEISNNENIILICDYDSVAQNVNSLITSKSIPKYTIVLERNPAIATGKMLIKNGIKAYANSRMLPKHFEQIQNTISQNDVWTYPELTAALIKATKKASLNQDAQDLIDSRLTDKEKDVIYLVLEGLTNDTIANELNITTRTVKAHISSIFSKVHVNDRISLILLLK